MLNKFIKFLRNKLNRFHRGPESDEREQENYCINEKNLRVLKSKGIPVEILEKLEDLYNIDISDKYEFTEKIKEKIGEKATEEYKFYFESTCQSSKQDKSSLREYTLLIRKTFQILTEAENCLLKIEKESHDSNLAEWDILFDLLSNNLPPYGLLEVFNELAKKDGKDFDLIKKFENLFKKIYDNLIKNRKKTRSIKLRSLYREKLKRILKIWQQFSLKLSEPLTDELVSYILEDGDDDISWIQFCVPHLGKDHLFKNISENFIKKIKEQSTVQMNEISSEQPELSLVEKQSFKSLINTQLALLNRHEFAWSYLNIARLAIVMDKNLYKQMPNKDIDEIINWGDDYIDWNIEQALQAGAELADIDRYIVAYAQSLKHNYHKVLELLREFSVGKDEKLEAKCNLLVAVALGKLWLINDREGDGKRSLELLSAIEKDIKLSSNEKFLLCQLLMKFERDKEAREIIDEIDLNIVNEEKIVIAKFVWDLEKFNKLDVFLIEALKSEKESVELFSLYCALLRTFKNQFFEAEKIISKIEELNPIHPWIMIKKCTDALDKNNLVECLNLFKNIPDNNGFWDQEKYLLKCRIELQKGEIEKAKRHLSRIKSKNRIDYLFWKATIFAYQKKFQDAYKEIADSSGDEVFQERIAALKAQLHLANGDYEDALALFLELDENPQIKEYKAWCYLNLEKYSDMENILKDLESENAKFLQALLFDTKEDHAKSYELYKQFLNNFSDGNPYLVNAVERFAYLLIKNDQIEDVQWLIDNERLNNYISNEKLVQLYALQKNWHKVIELLAGEEKQDIANNIVYAYQKLLFQLLKEKSWEQAKDVISKLKKIDDSIDEYEKFLLHAEFLDSIQKMEKKINYKNVENEKDESIQSALLLHKYINNKLTFDDIFQKMDEWTQKNADIPEPNLIMLIMCLANNNKEAAQHYAKQLDALIEKISDNDFKLISRVFISMILDDQKIDDEHLFYIFTNLNDKLPIKSTSFWNRIILTLAQHKVEQATGLIKKLHYKIDISKENKSRIYAKNALVNLNNNKITNAIENLENAIEV